MSLTGASRSRIPFSTSWSAAQGGHRLADGCGLKERLGGDRVVAASFFDAIPFGPIDLPIINDSYAHARNMVVLHPVQDVHDGKRFAPFSYRAGLQGILGRLIRRVHGRLPAGLGFYSFREEQNGRNRYVRMTILNKFFILASLIVGTQAGEPLQDGRSH